MFLKSLEDAVGEEQGDVCLHCEISKETATPVWRKDGLVLTPDDKHELLQFGKTLALIIHSLSKDDAGQYTCDLGTSQTKAKVSVHGERFQGSSWLLADGINALSSFGRVESQRFPILLLSNLHPQTCTSR